jgi:hypothetical protein
MAFLMLLLSPRAGLAKARAAITPRPAMTCVQLGPDFIYPSSFLPYIGHESIPIDETKPTLSGVPYLRKLEPGLLPL